MIIQEFQTIVTLEAICLLLIIMVIISAFKRWKAVLYASAALASVAFFSAWYPLTALGAILVYGSASSLLWLQLGQKYRHIQAIAWALLATGVIILIARNAYNIFIYLG